MTNPHDFDGVSFDFGKSPNFIYIEGLNNEIAKDKLVDIGFKSIECCVDLWFYYFDFFLKNKTCFFGFLGLILFFHFFAGKF